jgi:hypothetical protein
MEANHTRLYSSHPQLDGFHFDLTPLSLPAKKCEPSRFRLASLESGCAVRSKSQNSWAAESLLTRAVGFNKKCKHHSLSTHKLLDSESQVLLAASVERSEPPGFQRKLDPYYRSCSFVVGSNGGTLAACDSRIDGCKHCMFH